MTTEKEYYRDNIRLRKPGLSKEYTKEQVEEYLRCSEDPIYFIKNYMKIISLDRGIVLFDMYDFQEKMVNTFHDNRFSIVRVGRQSGKCQKFDTTITLKSKKSDEILTIPIGEFFEQIKNNS